MPGSSVIVMGGSVLRSGMSNSSSFDLPERLTLNADQLQGIGSVITEWAKAEQALFIATFQIFGGGPSSRNTSLT